MKLSDINEYIQTLAALGAIVALIAVAYEIRQSRDIAIADMFQQRSAMWLELSLHKSSPEQYATIQNKFADGDFALTEAQIQVLESLHSANFVYFENLHFQYQMGLIPEEEWHALQKHIAIDFLTPCLNEWWGRSRNFWRESFVKSIDSLLQRIDIPPCDFPDIVARYRGNLQIFKND